jgi:nitrite reductase (NO-forming)
VPFFNEEGSHLRRVAGIVVALTVLAVAGWTAGVFAASGGSSPTSVHASNTTIRVSVVATEFAFRLSRKSVPVGSTVIFSVVNKGKIAHDFAIAGKKTPLIQPGKTATLKVKPSKGLKPYKCTVLGHAAAGMKGVFAVGVKPVTTTTTQTTTTATTTTATTTTTSTTTPGNTQVHIDMTEFKFTLSQTTVPVGQVTFVVVNSGKILHNFTLPTINASTPDLSPGQSFTLTVTFSAAGSYEYVCTLPQHAEAGMAGTLKVQ